MEIDENSTDIENEMNLLNARKVRKKQLIFDSDSENETNFPEETELKQLNQEKGQVEKPPNEEVEDIEPVFTAGNVKKRIMVLASDSEEENESVTNSVTSRIVENNDESVIDEEEIEPHNKSFPDEETAIYIANDKGELIEEDLIAKRASALRALCNSSSSDEEPVIDKSAEKVVSSKSIRRTKKSNKEEAPKKMTAKEAAEQRSEIRAESQRMLRESNISLPYHVPKSYTIQEFLQKRSKLASALPQNSKAPPSIAIKMSKEQLKEVSKKLDERIKEVEEFYKSDDSEDEDDPTDAIRSWLGVIADKAVDSVEEKIQTLIIEGEQAETTTGEEKSDSLNQDESMEIEFNLDDSAENEPVKKPTISELIKDKLDLQPKLSGSSDEVIDLEEGVAKKSGVAQLLEKYFQHTAKKICHKHKVKLDVIEVVSGGEIVKETVSMNVDDEEEEPPLFEIPGAKIKKLKNELQDQIAQKRLEMWKQKQEQGELLDVEKSDKVKSMEDEGQGKDILDDEEEEFEMTESESEDEEEYDEEEELKNSEKKVVKSAFVDDEAAVEDDEEEEMDQDEDNDEDQDEDDNEEENAEDVSNIEEIESPRKKTLRRIIKPFSQDSDDEEQDNEPKKVLKYYPTDDDALSPNLPKILKTPQRLQLDENKSEGDFLTPVTYLTGLQNLNSTSKFSKDSPTSPLDLPSQPESQPMPQIPQKLFEENSQANLEDLEQICSGAFTTPSCENSQDLPSTQDLLSLCSGDFTQMPSTSSEATTSKEFKQPTPVQNKPESKITFDESDQIISQLLDEEEMERFKKKFESPVNPTVTKPPMEEAEEVNATGLINSDEETEELEVTKRKKKRKKLAFSDDEDDSEDNEEELYEDEEIDLHDSDDEEVQLEKAMVEKESGLYKASDFLDKEAELSESEWGSEDEDEKGLDVLEVEEGDQEKYNEKKVRRELEKIHMRQLLDEDNREVKILQELLLEDGEMHGTGRKRQFRWRTLDSDNTEFVKRDDDDIYLDEEEENEEQWRKMRHKREMFLKKKTPDEDDTILEDSQILKIGQQRVKSQSNTPATKSTQEDPQEPFSLLLNTKRGSFLSRSDQVLQRLAEYNKVTTTTVVGATAKNSKSFVFQTVQVAEATVIKDNNNKRKASEATPNAVKKLRLDNFSPAAAKSGPKSTRAKKLFKN